MAFNVHEVADGDNDLLNLLRQLARGSKDQGLAGFCIWVNLLQNRDGEGRGFAGSGLCLRNDIGAWYRSSVS